MDFTKVRWLAIDRHKNRVTFTLPEPYPGKYYLIFFVCQLVLQRPNLEHWQRKCFPHPMVITTLCLFWIKDHWDTRDEVEFPFHPDLWTSTLRLDVLCITICFITHNNSVALMKVVLAISIYKPPPWSVK